MPIPNTTVTPSQFDYLERNIASQYSQLGTVSSIAFSGLQYVVLLQVAAPEVDLVNPFAAQYTSMDGLNSTSNFTTIATALNLHVINRGTTLLSTDTLSTRLNRWLADNVLLVTRTFANISSGAGFFIDDANIEP